MYGYQHYTRAITYQILRTPDWLHVHLLGLGFGAYQAVDFALVMDVLPDEKDKAKDIACWHQVNLVANG